MRPGPSIPEMNDAGRWSARMDIRYGPRLFKDIPMTSCSLDWGELKVDGTSASAPASLRVGAPDDYAPQHEGDFYSNYGQMMCPSVICEFDHGGKYEIPFGRFRITETSQSPESSPVQGKDLLLDLEENPLSWPHSPHPGGTLITEMNRLNPNRGMTAIRVPDSRRDYQISPYLQLPTDLLVSMSMIAKEAGCGLRMSYQGEIEAYPLPTPSSAPVETYTQDSHMVIGAAPVQSPSGRIPNWYSVVAKGDGSRQYTVHKGDSYESAVKDDEKNKSEVEMAIDNLYLNKERVWAENATPTYQKDAARWSWSRQLDPHWTRTENGWKSDYDFNFYVKMNQAYGYYHPSWYGWVSKTTDLSSQKSWDKVVEEANRWAKFGMDRAKSWRIQLVADPRIEVGDVIAVEYKQGKWCVVSVTSFSLDLMDPSQPMTLTGAELRSW